MDLLEAWISQLYIARRIRGLQSRKPCRIESRTVLMTSPVKRPSCSREVGPPSSESVTVTSSRKTAMPWTGSWHNGPWAVASWNAYVILSEKSWAVRAAFDTGSEESVWAWLFSVS